MTVENTVFEQNQLSRWNDREVLHQLSRGPKLSQFYIYIYIYGFFWLRLAENMDLPVSISCIKILPFITSDISCLSKLKDNQPMETCPSRN